MYRNAAPPAPPRSRRGFTLIELLVVIAIIAILAAILFPVFQKVRENARAASCESNLKQLALSFSMYTNDSDGAYPMAFQWDSSWQSSDQSWIGGVLPYVKSTQVFACPDDPDGNRGAHSIPSASWLDVSFAGYGMSYVVNSYYGAWNGGFTEQGISPVSGQTGWLQAMNTESKITRPSDTVLLTEKFNSDVANSAEGKSDCCAWGNWSRYAGPSSFIGGPVMQGTNVSAYEIPDGTKPASNPFPTGPSGAVSTHHGADNKRANFAFADGHVKSMVPSATDPDPVKHPELNMWDGYR